VSSHYDGKQFFNPEGEEGDAGGEARGPLQFLEMVVAKRKWPRSVPVQPSVPAARVDGDGMRITWVGHATTLLQTQGLNILIDPMWEHFDSPVQVAVRPRVRAPGVSLKNLPKIDLILISHTHFDHLDMRSLKYVYDRDRPAVLGGLGINTLLRRHGIKAIEGDWNQRVTIKAGLDIALSRAHHWSGRALRDRNLVLWTGFVIILPGGNVYYAGDSGPGKMRWAAEAKPFGPVRLAILPIGPNFIKTPQSRYHITAAEAVSAFAQLGMPYTLGVHWGTFEMSDEPVNGARTLLNEALKAGKSPANRFRTLEAGEAWDVPAAMATKSH
jgi:L-ascorbate metabolism protein UlaG (beta-lactamase superfamily)